MINSYENNVTENRLFIFKMIVIIFTLLSVRMKCGLDTFSMGFERFTHMLFARIKISEFFSFIRDLLW